MIMTLRDVPVDGAPHNRFPLGNEIAVFFRLLRLHPVSQPLNDPNAGSNPGIVPSNSQTDTTIYMFRHAVSLPKTRESSKYSSPGIRDVKYFRSKKATRIGCR